MGISAIPRDGGDPHAVRPGGGKNGPQPSSPPEPDHNEKERL